MTVLELFDQCQIKSPLKILSGYNGKILCQKFVPEKHLKIAQRKVTAIWSDITVTKSAFGNYANPIMCAYVSGLEEYEEEQRKMKERENNG